MATIVKMPKLGLTMEEGTIIKWLKSEGEAVEKGEALLEIQTDKVNLEEEAPASGIVRKILVPEGAVVPVGQDIAIIAAADEPLPPPKEENTAEPAAAEHSEQSPSRREQTQQPQEDSEEIERKIKASPAAKRIARENDIDLSKVTPTGPDGRIVEKDVRDYMESRKIKATPLAKKMAGEQGIDLTAIEKAPGERITKQDLLGLQIREDHAFAAIKQTIPVTGMRKIIAEKMTKSKATAPHIYLSLDVDMTKAVELREKLIPAIEKQYGVKLSFSDILIKAAAVALKENPVINSSFTEEQIIIKQEINIGLAVALDNGLIVPVVKDADKKGLGSIARETKELIEKARTGKLMPDDYHGGTFTITNLGMYDIENFAAIINQPESAILAVGKIMKKPVVIDDSIVIRPMMNLTLSCDHRVIDGAQGARFLQRIKQILEEPLQMLM